MAFAQLLHALVSFVCREDTDERRPAVPSRTETLSARELFAKATTIRECLEAYVSAKEGELSDERVFDRLTRSARTFDDWLNAMEHVGQETGLGRMIVNRLLGMSLTFNQWEQVQRASTNEATRVQVGEKMLPLARTLEEKVRVYELSDEGLRKAVLEKIGQAAASFDDWKEACDNEHDEVQTVALQKMISLVETVDQLCEAAEAAEDDEAAEEQLATRLKAMPLDRKDLERILEDYDNSSYLFIAAYEKSLDMAASAPRCLELYLNWETEDNEDEKALKKLFALATPGECALIALLSEEGSILRERAEECKSALA